MTYLVTIYTTTKFLQTNRIRLIVILNLIFFGSHPFLCFSQDLYDLQHSRKYAEYLSSSHQYTLAAEEYERLVFFDKDNLSFKYKLIKNYRLSGDLGTGIKRIYSFYGNLPDTIPPVVANEFVKMQLLSDSLSVAENFINHKNRLSGENKSIYRCFDLLLDGDYKKAGLLAKDASVTYPAFPSDIFKLTEKANNLKFKSPFLAGSFSAVIPGTGKFYTKNWADGFVSMLFVAGSAWQAYRGFTEHGSKSAYGWTFATISASFYIGNIVGSVKAAKRYNKNRKNEIDNQISVFINSDSF
jgi:hypothetical protein